MRLHTNLCNDFLFHEVLMPRGNFSNDRKIDEIVRLFFGGLLSFDREEGSDIISERFILTVDITTFEPAGQKYFIGIAYQSVGQSMIPACADPTGIIIPGDGGLVCTDSSVPINQIFSNDNADIVEFHPLNCMDAADLIKGIRIDGKNIIVRKIPFCTEITDDDIPLTAPLFHIPVVAVSRTHTGFIIPVIRDKKGILHFLRCIKHPEIEVVCIEGEVGGFTYSEKMIKE